MEYPLKTLADSYLGRFLKSTWDSYLRYSNTPFKNSTVVGVSPSYKLTP